MVKLAVLTSHPIQYQAPLFREISKQTDIDLTVFFLSDFSLNSYKDKGFDQEIKWDIPLLDGYNHAFLPAYGPINNTSFFRPFSYGLKQELKEKKIDVLWVHGYSSQNYIRAIIQAKKLGIKVLFRGESNLKSGTKNPLKLFIKRIFLKLLFKNCKGFLAIGSLNRDYYRRYGVPERKIFHTPYAVDNLSFQHLINAYTKNREAFRLSLGLQPDRPIILYAGKLMTRKHPMDLLEAYIGLSDVEGKEPLPYLLYVGEGEESSRLKNHAKKTGWTSIKFLGFQNQSQLPAFFDLCDVFVLPSTKEPWGLIVNEVMNAGKPVIVSDQVGCAPDLVVDGENGYIFPARNIDALKTCLEKVISNPTSSTQMGEHSLQIINEWGFKEDIDGLRKALSI
jgi:glycosyltransferase involved in cell wall biosynthesis